MRADRAAASSPLPGGLNQEIQHCAQAEWEGDYRIETCLHFFSRSGLDVVILPPTLCCC